MAVPFMVSLTTATILVVIYNIHPERPFRAVFSWTHRISGVCLFFLPLLTVSRHRKEFGIYVHNTRQAWFWTLNDVKWLFLMGPSTLNKKIALPHQGKFNAAEKINYMVLTMTYPCYIVTGTLIWLPGVAIIAWLLHFSMAMIATPLILGHIFMATINPETRVGLTGMITGFVDRHWAKHHYRLWYDEHHGHTEAVEPVAAAARTVVNADRLAARPDAADAPSGAQHPPAISCPHAIAAVAAALPPGPLGDRETAAVVAKDGAALAVDPVSDLRVSEPEKVSPTAPAPAATPQAPRVRRRDERATFRPRPRFDAQPDAGEAAVWSAPLAQAGGDAPAGETAQ